jgi:hypothetical protein
MAGGPGPGDGPNGLFEAANKLRGSVESAEYKHRRDLIGMLGTQVFWGANPRAPIGG